jgi:hypothetical protein
MSSPKQIASEIYGAYKHRYDGEVQGCCPVIASDIINRIGGVAVAGRLRLGGNERTHWWVDLDGVTIDPMGDDFISHEDFFERVEVHRNQAIFVSILPRYEQWRIPHLPSQIP